MNMKTDEEAIQALRFLVDEGYARQSEKRDVITLRATEKADKFLKEWREQYRSEFRRDRYLVSQNSPRLKEVRIGGFKCFKTLQKISLCADGSDEPARWTVLIGENGVGKTTLLKLIAALYPEEMDLEGSGSIYDLVADNVDFVEPLLRRSNALESAYVECKYAVNDLEYEYPIITGAFVDWDERIDYTSELFIEIETLTSSFPRETIGILQGHSTVVAEFPLLAGYGASRYVGESRLAVVDERSRSNIRSLFEDDVALKNPEEWLLQADYSARFGRKNRSAERRLERIKAALVRLLPGISSVGVAPPDDYHDAPYVLFDSPFGHVDFTNLSFGYQSTVAWVVDFAARLFDRYSKLDNPLEGDAIVLLDEIDLHAHPKWQRTIMSHLETVFPNTQFITTTHSPIVVQASPDVNIVLLQARDDSVAVVNDLDRVKQWRVDQILTSDLFGLESAAPDYIKEMEKRRIDLLRKSALRRHEREELKFLDDTLSRLPLTADPTADKARKLILDFASRVQGS